ncbi:MAG TPA: AglZ/HisF2 family acetamidino modification protein [Chitinophagaceae bacterium]|nr:AglZ/HisF2 family acetamidino modification protein [Chitinophagaceae bacterium]
MLKTRIIPCLQLIGDSLVKTVKFKNPDYIGDPINTVRIFNELEVDELCFLDIRASVEGREPNIEILHQISNECFMPLAYGGGIKDFETAKQIFAIGFEKVVINTQAHHQLKLVSSVSEYFGAQAMVASIDVKKNVWGKYNVFINDGTEKIEKDAVEWATELEMAGAGEILLTSMDKDGTWSGFDVEITKRISEAVKIPVIANGGAGSMEHISQAIKNGKASAVALGSMVVYQQKGMGVLVNFPDKEKLEKII